MEWLTTEDACDLLRVGEESSGIIEALAAAVPEYIETVTGYPASRTETEPHETVKQLARFLLALWFNPDGTDATQLQRVVDSLTLAVKSMVVFIEAHGENPMQKFA